MNPGDQKPRAIGLTLRTALLSWLVTITTLTVFILVVVPQQKESFLRSLDSKAHGMAVSLRDFAAGAAINEDFTSVVDHCKDVIQGDPSMEYIVITRNDGFSLIHQRNGWRAEPGIGPEWRPQKRETTSGIQFVPLFNQHVFHCSQPFDYQGIEWGWIHVGLTLNSYDESVRKVYLRTGLLAVACFGIGLAASVIYARRLLKPILNLRQVVQQVTGGDLSARAIVEGNDELSSLASSVNTMSASLQQRDRILQSVRFAAERFLSTMNWEEVIQEVLQRLGEAASASRVYLLENQFSETHGERSSLRFEWIAAGGVPFIRDSRFKTLSWASDTLSPHASQLKQFRVVRTRPQNSIFHSDTPAENEEAGQSLLIPIQVENQWWGVLGVDSIGSSGSLSEAEQDTLRAAAGMLGAAITRQQTQNALLKAKEYAEAASDAKSQFLANMSHEIRTPITGVLGMLRLLHRTPLNDNQRRYVSNTMDSADALLRVIGDILDFSKIEAGRLELEKSPFSIAHTVEMTLRLLIEKAEAKGIEIASLIAPDIPAIVVGDPDRLRQILLNLLSNAIKFTEAGSITVGCTISAISAGEVIVRFEVRDTGVGIPEEQQPVIFEAFRQGDSSMSRLHGGTGLGLTICQQLVKLMGGEIGVRSSPRVGSTFWFTARFQPQEQDSATPGLLKRQPNLESLRVLVVDDCPQVQRCVCEYIRTWQGVPECATSGEEALIMLRRAADTSTPFSVAVLDWKMPVMDGVSLAGIIRQDDHLHSTGLVLLSGFTTEGHDLELQAAGFTATVSKPIRKSELYNAILAAATRRPGAGRPANDPGDPAGHPQSTAPSTHPQNAQVKGTVVLAEDNDINQEVAVEMLKEIGYVCLRARNGREAVQKVQQSTPDLVLMDCQMPEIDGYAATRLIREWERQLPITGKNRRRIPIVALTAHAMKGDRARCLEAGMDDYLTKPLALESLASVMEKFLKAKTTTRHPSKTDDSPESSPGIPDGLPGIDLPSLLSRCMGKTDLVLRLYRKFQTQGVSDMDQLQGALDSSDTARIASISHRLKGSAANVSALEIRDLAAQIEEAARQSDLPKAAALLGRLREVFERISQHPA